MKNEKIPPPPQIVVDRLIERHGRVVREAFTVPLDGDPDDDESEAEK